MSQPVEYLAKRYRCPHCRKSLSSRSRMVEHMARCWFSPEVRGCKTCKHFESAGGGGPDHGMHEWNPPYDESCVVGVDLSGRCPACGLRGEDAAASTGWRTTGCGTCHGWPPKAGPITDCVKWEVAS